jgi:hypothetical protein
VSVCVDCDPTFNGNKGSVSSVTASDCVKLIVQCEVPYKKIRDEIKRLKLLYRLKNR